jgi:hypothetical protein
MAVSLSRVAVFAAGLQPAQLLPRRRLQRRAARPGPVRRCGRAGAALLAADALLSAFASLSVCARSYGQTIEVDYRGYDVTVENFLRVLTGACRSRVSARVRSHMSTVLTRSRCAGRHEAWVPRSKRLLSDAAANVLVYMTGHGGDEFLKFQDQARTFADRRAPLRVCAACVLACSPRQPPGGDLVDGHRGRAGADGGEAPLPRGTRGRLLSVLCAALASAVRLAHA